MSKISPKDKEALVTWAWDVACTELDRYIDDAGHIDPEIGKKIKAKAKELRSHEDH